MPIVSVNLSGSSYRVYEQWKKNRNGSRMISAAIMAYELRQLEDRLRPGDIRVAITGEELEWTGDGGWKVIGDEEE
jgi:hypothetical protein